jgi:hypothetical protein
VGSLSNSSLLLPMCLLVVTPPYFVLPAESSGSLAYSSVALDNILSLRTPVLSSLLTPVGLPSRKTLVQSLRNGAKQDDSIAPLQSPQRMAAASVAVPIIACVHGDCAPSALNGKLGICFPNIFVRKSYDAVASKHWQRLARGGKAAPVVFAHSLFVHAPIS